jgi:uncharacterized protein
MLGELTKAEIEELLTSSVIGRIGCCADKKMLVVPVTYVYTGDAVIGHTGEGMKIDILRRNPECCFEVDKMENISTWQSVMASGTFEELNGDEALEAMEKLVKKLAPLLPSETSHPHRMGPNSTKPMSTQGKNSIIYRIRLKEKTGRFER